jgi:hypothetical protein
MNYSTGKAQRTITTAITTTTTKSEKDESCKITPNLEPPWPFVPLEAESNGERGTGMALRAVHGRWLMAMA